MFEEKTVQYEHRLAVFWVIVPPYVTEAVI